MDQIRTGCRTGRGLIPYSLLIVLFIILDHLDRKNREKEGLREVEGKNLDFIRKKFKISKL